MGYQSFLLRLSLLSQLGFKAIEAAQWSKAKKITHYCSKISFDATLFVRFRFLRETFFIFSSFLQLLAKLPDRFSVELRPESVGQSLLLLPALVLAQQLVAVGAVVLSHVEGRAAERDEATGPAAGSIEQAF